MSKQNYDYFKQNLTELLVKYQNKYIVIKDLSVIGSYDSFDEAYENTIKTEELGTFIIQHCVDETAETYIFVSGNVAFV